MRTGKTGVVLLVLALVAGTVRADLVTNGNFEADPYDAGWSYGEGPSTSIAHRGLTATGLDVEGSQAAYLIGGAGSSVNHMEQTFQSGPEWQVDMLFAAEITDYKSLSLRLDYKNTDDTVGCIYIRVMKNQRLQAYNKAISSYNQIAHTEVSYSVDANGNNSFDDEGDTLNVHSFRIVGHFDDVAPSWDVYLSDPNSSALNLIASGLTWFGGVPATTGATLYKIEFQTSTATSAILVDNISVTPEPATLSLLAIGGLTLVRRRR